MDENEFLAGRFEAHRDHLKAVAYRMLGSLSEAEDAVQESWLRLSRTGAGEIDNLPGWLTTVVGRVCLDMLRSRTARRETPLETHLPDPIVSGTGPEDEALLADSVGIALLVVLEALAPAERLAFVLHDMFAVPFEDIAAVIGCSPAAARQQASRARRRVRGTAPAPDPDLGRQREVVDAFLAAARDGDLDALVAVLHPDVVLRADAPRGLRVVHGRDAVARQAGTFHRVAHGFEVRPVVVNGAAGLVSTVDGKPMSLLSFTIVGDQIVALDIIVDPGRLERMDLA